MKNKYMMFYSLLMFTLAACSSSTFKGVNKVDDDVYWSAKDEPKTGKSYKDIEPWNKGKGPNVNLSQAGYEPNDQSLSASSEQSYTNIEDERGVIAYQTWLKKYNQNAALPEDDTSKQSNILLADRENERDARRFGSDRNYYYDDPYYNVLSSNWGWTNFYAPVVRPGFYNWAPGWNVGLTWNNFSGFGVNVGYNMGWGGMGYGYNLYSAWAYDPWFAPYGAYGGFYNPYYGGYYGRYYGAYGYNPYGYNPFGFYNPYGWGGAYCHNNRYGNYYGNNDVVTNRPIIRPRNSMGSTVVPPGSRPSGTAMAGEQRVKNDRPSYGEARPAVENTSSVRTNRPGGDLYIDKSGRPVYVSPNSRPEAATTEPASRYSNRPGGDLRTGSDGRIEYVPARPRDMVDNQTRPSSDVGSNGNRPNYGSPSYSTPRNEGGSEARPYSSAPSNNRPSYDVPSSSRPSSNPTPSYSAPPSRPSYSSPSMSRPASSSAPSGGSPGGSVRPR